MHSLDGIPLLSKSFGTMYSMGGISSWCVLSFRVELSTYFTVVMLTVFILLQTGTYGLGDATFLNSLMPGWDVSSVSCKTVSVNAVGAAGTPWEGNNDLDVSSRVSCLLRH